MEQTVISLIYFISQFSVPAQSQDKSVMGLFSVIPAAERFSDSEITCTTAGSILLAQAIFFFFNQSVQ